MNITQKTLFVLILILCMVGYRYPLRFDVTHNQYNTLSKANRSLLAKIDKPLSLQLFTPDQKISLAVTHTLSLFQQENPGIQQIVHAPILPPEQKRRLKLRSAHNLVITYENRVKAVDVDITQWNENVFGNLIQQVLHDTEKWIVFLSNHGEQTLEEKDSHQSLSLLSHELRNKGLKVTTLNLAEAGFIPDNTQLVVIADNQTPLLPQETAQIVAYLQRGGNFLWLASPHSNTDLTEISTILGVEWPKGIIVDEKSHDLGTPNAAVSIITQYPNHPITQALNTLTVFPWSRSLHYTQATDLGWQISPLLVTNASTHLEGHKDSQHGPFTIGIALAKNTQRIVVVGNSHFLSNANLLNYGNLCLATNIFNWLNEADRLLNIPPKATMDALFTQSAFTKGMIQYVFPYGFPFIYLLIAFALSRIRQRKFRSP